MNSLRFLDGFCGLGGATEGITQAGADVAVAVNHDEAAITTHSANHPGVLHLNHDIRKVNPADLLHLGINAIWWSAECTNFSVAKGGMGRREDSRMLSQEGLRFVHVLRPDYFFVENVREIMLWGPLVPKKVKGAVLTASQAKTERDFVQTQLDLMETQVARYTGKPWVTDFKLLRRYKALSLRMERWDCLLRDKRGGLVLTMDEQTKGIFFTRWVEVLRSMGYSYEYRLLNAADFGMRQQRRRYFAIFAREGLPIAWPEQTHAKNPQPGSGLERWLPCADILDLTDQGKSLLTERPALGSDNTLRRIESGLNRYGPQFLQAYYSSGGNAEANVGSIQAPLGCVVTKDRYSLCTAALLVEHKGAGGRNCKDRVKSVNDPHLTITTGHHPSLVQASLIDGYTHNSPLYPPYRPLSAVMAGREPYLFSAHLIERYNTDAPMLTVADPLPTITAHKPPYLVTLEGSKGAFIFRRARGPLPQGCREVNGYYVSNNIADIRMRPLHVEELAAAQGFPPGYRFHRTNKQLSKKFIGNAVPVEMARLLVAAILRALSMIQTSSVA